MTVGRLIAVVGASGAGKDSIIAGITAARPEIRSVHRTITRAEGLGGEDYHAVGQDAFDAAAKAGAFCLQWSAHGLSYGIPARVLDEVRLGEWLIANLSRGVLARASAIFPALHVLNVTAPYETRFARLENRGREDREDIEHRLSRGASPLPPGLHVDEIRNDGALADAVNAAVRALEMEPDGLRSPVFQMPPSGKES